MEGITEQIRREGTVLGECAIILVTVGNHYQGFDRLVRKMDEIARLSPEKIVMQTGSTKYKPMYSEHFDFVDYGSMQELNRQARIIVCHAGVGSILTALEFNKPLIMVPRLKKYDEVSDDHQLEIAEALSGHRHIGVVYDVDSLPDALSYDFDPPRAHQTNELVQRLNSYLQGVKIT